VAKEKIPDLSELVERSKEGDTQAFGEIYDTLVKPVYRYVFYRVDQDVAEDITEETFLKVWQNLKKYKKGKNPFSSWVFRIAHNLVCDHYRQHQAVDEIDDQVADPNDFADPVRLTNIKLNQVKLRSAIVKLPENYQQVITLKYINELENSEIATVLDKSEGAVRTLQSRALAQLRTILEKKQEDF